MEIQWYIWDMAWVNKHARHHLRQHLQCTALSTQALTKEYIVQIILKTKQHLHIGQPASMCTTAFACRNMELHQGAQSPTQQGHLHT